MAIHVLRLGSPRKRNEGLRMGTVRRPPRGVPKTQFAKLDFYDVWLPDLAPSQELVTFAQRSAGEMSWKSFERKYRAEMNKPAAARLLDLLAALSHQTSFSLGCYCENEDRSTGPFSRSYLPSAARNSPETPDSGHERGICLGSVRNNLVIVGAECRSSIHHERYAAGGGSRPFRNLEPSLPPGTWPGQFPRELSVPSWLLCRQ